MLAVAWISCFNLHYPLIHRHPPPTSDGQYNRLGLFVRGNEVGQHVRHLTLVSVPVKETGRSRNQ